MWAPEGQTKSVHNREVSTLVELGGAMDQTNGPGKKCPQWWGAHKGGVSTGWDSTVSVSTEQGLHFQLNIKATTGGL